MGVETDDRQRQVIMKYIHCFLFFFVLLATPLWAQDPPADPPAQPKPDPKDSKDYSVQLPVLMPPDGDKHPIDPICAGWNCPCLCRCQKKYKSRSARSRSKCEKRCKC